MLSPKPYPPERRRRSRVALPRARTVADPGDITFLLGVVRRNWRLILRSAPRASLSAPAISWLRRRSIVASSRILIDFRRLSPVGENELLINFKVNDAAVDSQTTMIESEGLMRAVIERLALQDDPEFVGTARWWKSSWAVRDRAQSRPR